MTEPVEGPSRRRRAPVGVTLLIIGSLILSIGLTVTAARVTQIALSRVGHSANSGDTAQGNADDKPHGLEVTQPDPLVPGLPGQPTALDPVACPGACFGTGDALTKFDSIGDLRSLGMVDRLDSAGDDTAYGLAEDFSDTVGDWHDAQGSPDACFFTYFTEPVALPVDADHPVDSSSIRDIGAWQDDDERSNLSQSQRVFMTSAEAEAHMTELAAMISGCSRYQTDDGGSLGTEVLPAPALAVPGSVAAVGWVEESNDGPGRYYVIDLQRANVVVRTILSTDPGLITEKDFRLFVQRAAARMAGWVPDEAAVVPNS